MAASVPRQVVIIVAGLTADDPQAFAVISGYSSD